MIWQSMKARGRTAVTVAAALLSLGGAVLLSPAAAQAQPAGVDVFPMPGSALATPQTQITFRGVSPAALGMITVSGSRSGVHAGVFKTDSDGRGGSFLPNQPFTPGETVTVSDALPILNTGAKTPPTSYTFTVSTPAPPFPSLHWPPAARVSGDVQSFHSRHDLSPVSITVTHRGATGHGDIFIAPQWGPVQDGPMILDGNGNVIWFDRLLGNDSPSDFRVQSYHGQPVLTWWEGYLHPPGAGVGQDVIYDDTYRQIATVKGGNGLSADLHEFQLTPQGTALITCAYPVYWNASSVHASTHEIVLDYAVQEIDIPTGLVLFQWNALDHIPLRDSYTAPPKSLGSPFDAYHLNSVDVDRDGNLLIGARNTNAAYKVNRQTGAAIWTLGGRHSSFKLARGTYWHYQHDFRVRANNDLFLTLFDDGWGPPQGPQSRALKLILDTRHMTARAVSAHYHSPPVEAFFEGNYQQLARGFDFVGWGSAPYFSEFAPNGRLVFEGQMDDANSSYRSYRFYWNAVPWTLPAIAASRHGSRDAVYMSWNGATGVASWRVLGGASPSALRQLTKVTKQGFETSASVPAQAYVQVQALDVRGHVIKSSNAIAVH